VPELGTLEVGNEYIMEFLYYNVPSHDNQIRQLTPESRDPQSRGHAGYRYVDVEDEEGMVRYSLRKDAVAGTSDPVDRYGNRTSAPQPFSRYAVVYEDIPDPEARASWIAGGRVRVVDQETGEILGEFVRYAFERGFGSTVGERSPWFFAFQCPESSYGGRGGHIRSFVEQVVKPKQEE